MKKALVFIFVLLYHFLNGQDISILNAFIDCSRENLNCEIESENEWFKNLAAYKNKSILHDCKFSVQTADHDIEIILKNLLQAICGTRTSDRVDKEVYSQFLAAIQDSREGNYKKLEAECLRHFISYCLFSKNNLSGLNKYIQRHREIAYDNLEALQNAYFRLRLKTETDHIEGRGDVHDEKVFDSLILLCHQNEFHKLETEFRSVHAVQLEQLKLYTRAIQNYDSTLISAAKVSPEYFKNVQFSTYANLGALERFRDNFKPALRYFHRAINADMANQMLENKSKIYKWMAESHEHLNAYDSAHYYLNLSYEANLANKSEEHSAAVKEIQSKYDNEKLSRELAEESLKRKNNNLMAVSVGSLLLLLALFFRYRFKTQQQKNKEIEKDLVIANKETQLAAVNARLDGQETERKNLANHLHDNIVGQLVAANLHLKIASKNQSTEAINKSSELVHNLGIQIRNISHELYPPILLKMGLGTALIDLIEKYSNHNIKFEINEEDAKSIKYKGDNVAKIYYVVQELLNNTLKHSKADHAGIRIKVVQDQLHITVYDNGIGMNANTTESTGLGLNTVSARITSLGGTIENQPTENYKTNYIIKVPIKNLGLGL